MTYSTHIAAHDLRPKRPNYANPEIENEYYAQHDFEFRHIRTFWNWLVLACLAVSVVRIGFKKQKPAHSI